MDSPLRPAVIGSRFLRNQCCVLIFERAISLFRSGRQTVDSFIHRATRSKMAGFKTAPLFWGYGQGRFFGCAGSAKFCAYSGVSLILTRPGEGGHCSGDTPAENTVAVCYTISRMPKMAPVRTNRGRNLVTTLLLKNERKYYLPKMENRFRFSFSGSERTWPFSSLVRNSRQNE